MSRNFKVHIVEDDKTTRRLLENKEGRINTTSYAGVALLTGDVPTQADKEEAARLVSKVDKVTRVVNELRVGEPTPLSVRSNDSWITTRVSTATPIGDHRPA